MRAMRHLLDVSWLHIDMNILQIGTSDISGGAASISWSIKKGMEKRGHQVKVFVADKDSDDPGVLIIPRRFHRFIYVLLSNDINYSKTDWIIDTPEFKSADLIHIHNIHGRYFNLETLEKMSKLKPVIWTLHDMWAITPHCAYSYSNELGKNGFFKCRSLKSYPRILWDNEKYLVKKKMSIYNRSKFSIVTPSLWLKDMVSISVLKNKDTNLIYNGINENIFTLKNQIEVRRKLGLEIDKKIFLFLSDGGKNNEFKGWDFIVEVLKNYANRSDVLFLCIGGNENGLDDNFKNLLYIPKIKDKHLLSEYFSAADIFLYPTLAETFGLVITEAMACGTPVVTFKTGGVPEIVDHLKNGYVAGYRDAGDLINGIEYILNLDGEARQKMKIDCRDKVVNNFSEDYMIEQYENLYKTILEENLNYEK